MKVAMPKGSAHGWGVAGTYLAEEIARLPHVEGVTLHCIEGYNFKPLYSGEWDRINIGYCFFEHPQWSYPYIAEAATTWDHIVAGSSWCEEHLRRGGMERTSTILQGMDPLRFSCQPPRSDDGRFIVYSGGKFEYRKGQDIVIAAMKVFMERHHDVWLSCSWHNVWPHTMKSMQQSRLITFDWTNVSCTELLHNVVVRNGLDPARVLIHPCLSNSRMPLIYGESDMGIFPNRCEGGNNMIMCEYMACGRTVIASNRTGHADVLNEENALCLQSYQSIPVIEGGVETAVWPEPSVEELLEHLETAYHDRRLLQDKGKAAAKDMTRLSWSNAARRFHEIAVRLACPSTEGESCRSSRISEAETLFHAGNYGDAERIYRETLATFPLNASLHNCLATVLDRQGRYQEALAHYFKAAALQPGAGTIRVNLANTLVRLGRADDAIAEFEAVVTEDADCLEAWQGLAHCHRERGHRAETARCLEQVVRIAPEVARHRGDLASAYELLRRFDDALANLDAALTVMPASVEYLNARGLVLHELERLDESEASYREALCIEPRNGVVCNNIGNVIKSRAMLNESLAWYDRALESDPDNATIIFNRALAHLALGNFREGWPGYERRFGMIPPVVLPRSDLPLWSGEPLNGKRLLVQAEQVYGDTFMFARFARLAARCGGPVVFECQDNSVRKALWSLGQELELVTVRGEIPPVIDLRIPLLSLPRLFSITLDSIPSSQGYLKANPELIEKWSFLIPQNNDSLSVGLVWGGRKAPLNADRSMQLKLLEPLFSLPGANFFSLQLGEDLNQLTPYRGCVTDLSPQLADFAETAAALANLDLIITIDTAIAHLAGAMGKPVWVMLKHSPDWRWLQGRRDSPWYASARLYRQKMPGDWGDVVRSIVADLKKTTRKKKS
ncbi:MAG: tetratricopeptide repeat protein [Desulfuromonadaceae bacterium]